ncbi:Peptidase C13, legumain, partial [Candidatus Magnetomorum sp. HK-1]
MGIEIKGDNVFIADKFNSRIQQFNLHGEFIKSFSCNVQDPDSNLPSGPDSIAMDTYGNFYVPDSGQILNFAHEKIKKFSYDGRFMDVWRSSGSNERFFFHPLGITVDKDETLYVCDQMNRRIQIYSNEKGWKQLYHKDLFMPFDITINIDDTLYITDFNNNQILKIDKQGNLINSLFKNSSVLKDPTGISNDNEGYIYVADSGNHRIIKCDNQGEYILEWGKEGDGNGEFILPNDVLVDQINKWIYVTDSKNNCIQKFDLDGNFLLKWGNSDLGNNSFSFPFGIALDSLSNVIIVDKNNKSIKKYNYLGEFLYEYEIGSIGVGPGQLYEPTCIAIGHDDKIYISDIYLNRIQVFKKIHLTEGITKAIIIAGKLSDDDYLWPSVETSANFAYWTLIHQGIDKNQIYYLSSNTEFDIDGNNIYDDIDAAANIKNVKYAILKWLLEEPQADSLILYLVDHGSDGEFHLNSNNETLKATVLNEWLENLKDKYNESSKLLKQTMIIYDACYSGSFINPLKPLLDNDRIIITSTSSNEKAYFVNKGMISFSNFFWNNIFNGKSIQNSYDYASKAMKGFNQTPNISLNDLSLLSTVYIGNSNKIQGEVPVIEKVEVIQSTGNAGDSIKIIAEGVSDDIAIKQVLAKIKPDSYSIGQIAEVTNMYSVELIYNEETGKYEGEYTGSSLEESYDVIVVANDHDNNVSIPKVQKVSLNPLLKNKALIIAGYSNDTFIQKAISEGVQTALKA